MHEFNKTFLVDDEEYGKLLSGEHSLGGLVVREEKGQIFQHINPVERVEYNEDKELPDVVTDYEMSEDEKLSTNVIVTGAVVVIASAIALVAGVSAHIISKKKMKNKNENMAIHSKNEIETLKTEFNEDLNKYIQAKENNNLTSECVDELINSIDKIKKLNSDEYQAFVKSLSDIGTITTSVKEYTVSLEEHNNAVATDDTEEMSDDNIIRLEHYLNRQKKTLNKVS